jgi:hypothetical protein
MKHCFGGSEPKLIVYSYSSLARDIDGRKSTSGFGYPFRGSSDMTKKIAIVCCFEYN